MNNGLALTVGIPTYNRPMAVAKCLAALTNQTKQPREIIIVDSSPNDDTEAVVRNFKKLPIKYLKFRERTHLPRGRNIILKHCSTPLLAYLDDDAIPKARWAQTIIHVFSKYDIVGATGPTINTTLGLAPLEKIIRTSRNRNFFLPWGEVRSDARRWIPPQPVFCTTMGGGNMSFLTDKLREVGGFNENLIDPSFREDSYTVTALVRKKYKLIYHPEMFAYHVPGISGGISDIEDRRSLYFYKIGQNHRYFSDTYFPKWLSRLSWIFWSRNPPCLLWAAPLLTILRRENYFAWHKGLWSKKAIKRD